MSNTLEEVFWSIPKVGDAVKVVTEDRQEVNALVVAVHGEGYKPSDGMGYGPSVNVAFVSTDPHKHDPYGTQLERYSSLSHLNSCKTMPNPGRYWYQNA
jgi:hypothetical protein